MSYEVELNYRLKGDAYKIVLTTPSLDALLQVAREPGIAKKERENLVAALVDSKTVSMIRRYKNGKQEDGPAEEAGEMAFYKGTMFQEVHYRDGLMNDSFSGGPAVRNFDLYVGYLTRVEYRRNDVLHDGAHGAPAVQGFDASDNLVFAESYSEGQLVKTLSKNELMAYRLRMKPGLPGNDDVQEKLDNAFGKGAVQVRRL